jgi:hypothetical protein
MTVSESSGTVEVLLQTSIPTAEALVGRLAAEGVDAEIIDHPSSLALILACGTYRVLIGVPSEQLESAKGWMRDWEPDVRANVKELSKNVYRQALTALIPGLAVLGGNLWIMGEFRLLMVVPALIVCFLAFMAQAFFQRSRLR